MPRSPRDFVPGVSVHLMQRGNNRMPVFHDAADCISLLATLRHAVGRYDVEPDPQDHRRSSRAPSGGPVEDNGRRQTPTRLDGMAAEARRPEHSRDHRFTMSPLVRLPERPKFSPGMKMLQKSMPLPAGPLSHAATV